MATEDRYTIPDHLPDKLSIGMFIWNWVTMAAPGEPYDDLDEAVAGLPERGFNAVRVDAGLNWCFRPDGRPRGEMEFGPWIAGYRDNLTSVNAVGGGRHDVLKRVVRLMELARRCGVYVILTSWEYQDSSWFVADPKIRAEVMAIPEPDRFMHLARQHDRLLRVLKDKGLDRNIAFVEVHNEPDASLFPQGAEGRKLHEEAIAFLRDAHGDILVSGDYTTHEPSIVPDNVQVYDQHLYVGVSLYFNALYSQTVRHKDFDPANPRKLELLDRLLKDRIVPYEQFAGPAGNIREFWRPIHWLYHNLDVARFDEWILQQYRRDQAAITDTAVKTMQADAQEAARRKLPAVCDEGGYFYPPLESKFELTQPGMGLFELMGDLAIRHDYWGFMPTTYCGPEHPLWQDIDWLRRINGRFRASGKGQ
ncbi:MAG TPA: cellulase-like family protein [Phycisphaerae bacterium]|nr:cellulase-like family protein [Phycisphaerae bacterium]